MNQRIAHRLAELNADYRTITGEPFQRFYCPILFRDEKGAPLCRAHIENQAFEDSSGAWTIQRKDVDNYFGSRFEAAFTKIALHGTLGQQDVLGDRTLRRKLKPKIRVGEREVDFFIPKSSVPERYVALHADDEGLPPLVGLKISNEEMNALAPCDWTVEIETDLRIPALVSLIKAAHLTNFLILGYRYALSAGGHFVGHDLLGKFFLQNQRASVQDAEEAALGHFANVTAMVRPVEGGFLGVNGSVADRTFLVCWGSSGLPWAQITFIRAGDQTHGVMTPVSDRIEALEAFFDFMKNDNESVCVKVAQFVDRNAKFPWHFSEKTFRVPWPKKDVQLR